jgi:lipopolysaccharide export system protein LptC
MDTYSRIIAFLKVMLPLAALAILATLFFLSRSVDPTATIPFAEGDMADRLRDQQVTAPFFSGTTPKGDEVIFTASVVRPAVFGRPAEADNISARLTFADGARVTLDAAQGQVDVGQDTATFTGNVRIASSLGYRLSTDKMTASLSGVSGFAPGQVDGVGPFGTLTAGALEIGPQNPDGPVHIVFKSGVKLIYDPKQQER